MSRQPQGKRKQKSLIHIVGEGSTELHYFQHIKRLCKFQCVVRPGLFKDSSVTDIGKRARKILRSNTPVICVFDTDVVKNDKDRNKLNALRKTLEENNSLCCDSFPSIEYWFLLHYEDTDHYFATSGDVTEELKRYINNYEKKVKFLVKEEWVSSLCSDRKLDKAIERAENRDKNNESYDRSYTRIYKAFKRLKGTIRTDTKAYPI